MNFDTGNKWFLKLEDLEKSLGDGVKKVEKNEKLTSYIQRRAFYAQKEIQKGEVIRLNSIFPLRPYLKNSFLPTKKNY